MVTNTHWCALKFYFCTLSTFSISFKKLHMDGLLISFIDVMLYLQRREFRWGQSGRRCFNVWISVLQWHNLSSLLMRGVENRPVSILSLCDLVLYRVRVIRSGSNAGRELGHSNDGLHRKYAPNLESASTLLPFSIFSSIFCLNSTLRESWQFFEVLYSVSKFV